MSGSRSDIIDDTLIAEANAILATFASGSSGPVMRSRSPVSPIPWRSSTVPDRPITARARGVYVASRASIPGRAAMWRRLRSEGWPIVSSWIDEDGPGQTEDMGELWSRIGREVAAASGLVLYIEPGDFPLKGALIEVGMALASGVPVIVVAPAVVVELPSFRPIGSWMGHPLVEVSQSPVNAFRKLGVDCNA